MGKWDTDKNFAKTGSQSCRGLWPAAKNHLINSVTLILCRLLMSSIPLSAACRTSSFSHVSLLETINFLRSGKCRIFLNNGAYSADHKRRSFCQTGINERITFSKTELKLKVHSIFLLLQNIYVGTYIQPALLAWSNCIAWWSVWSGALCSGPKK